MDSEKELYTRRHPVKRKPADKHDRTTTENQKENPKSVSALLFLSWYIISLYPVNAVDAMSIVSFFHSAIYKL